MHVISKTKLPCPFFIAVWFELT